MIPKIIHYCWFGGNPLPELAQKCIASWKKYCPDYEIIEWNESNFDFSDCAYAKEAYEAKKWAFVSDYARFKILYENGGVYFDTDVELIRPIDELLLNKAFFGFESFNKINLGHGFAAEKNHSVLKELMEGYIQRPFIKDDGSFDLTPSPIIDTPIFINHGIKMNNELQNTGIFAVYPQEFFSPMDFYSGKIYSTDNTYSIHHFMASWFSDEERYIKEKRAMLAKHLPFKFAHWLSLIFGFTKYRGVFKMPKALIDFKLENLRKIKEFETDNKSI